MCQSGYIDIHTHILPGLDDGAQDMDMTVELLKAQIAEGVTGIIATPHFDVEENFQDIGVLKEKLRLVQEKAASLSKDLTIYGGCEILFNQGILELLGQGRIPTLADTNYVLVEFYPDEGHNEIYHAMHDMIQMGKIPILAHVERYESLFHHEEYVHDLVELGAYIQMNTSSLTGGYFDGRTRFCKSLVKKGYVHFLGSDCHNMGHRPPQMKRAAQVLAKIAGEHMMRKLTCDNAKILLCNEYI